MAQPAKRILLVANALFSLPAPTSLLVFLMVAASVFGGLWTVSESAGVKGSLSVVVLLGTTTLIIMGIVLLVRILRWNLVVWGLKTSLAPIIRFDPTLIIGFGFGGGIIGGIMGKLIAEKTGREPAYYVVDRTFIQDQRVLRVEVGTLSIDNLLKHQKVLLVTAEVRSGNSLASVSAYLDSVGLAHKTFTFLLSTSAPVIVDQHVLRSDARGILPWDPAPARRELLRGGND